MQIRDLVIGEKYVVRGQGYMKLENIGGPLGAVFCVMRTHGNCDYWVDPIDLLREADANFIQEHTRQAKLRGVDCQDLDCWCRHA